MESTKFVDEEKINLNELMKEIIFSEIFGFDENNKLIINNKNNLQKQYPNIYQYASKIIGNYLGLKLIYENIINNESISTENKDIIKDIYDYLFEKKYYFSYLVFLFNNLCEYDEVQNKEGLYVLIENKLGKKTNYFELISFPILQYNTIKTCNGMTIDFNKMYLMLFDLENRKVITERFLSRYGLSKNTKKDYKPSIASFINEIGEILNENTIIDTSILKEIEGGDLTNYDKYISTLKKIVILQNICHSLLDHKGFLIGENVTLYQGINKILEINEMLSSKNILIGLSGTIKTIQAEIKGDTEKSNIDKIKALLDKMENEGIISITKEHLTQTINEGASQGSLNLKKQSDLLKKITELNKCLETIKSIQEQNVKISSYYKLIFDSYFSFIKRIDEENYEPNNELLSNIDELIIKINSMNSTFEENNIRSIFDVDMISNFRYDIENKVFQSEIYSKIKSNDYKSAIININEYILKYGSDDFIEYISENISIRGYINQCFERLYNDDEHEEISDIYETIGKSHNKILSGIKGKIIQKIYEETFKGIELFFISDGNHKTILSKIKLINQKIKIFNDKNGTNEISDIIDLIVSSNDLIIDESDEENEEDEKDEITNYHDMIDIKILSSLINELIYIDNDIPKGLKESIKSSFSRYIDKLGHSHLISKILYNIKKITKGIYIDFEKEGDIEIAFSEYISFITEFTQDNEIGTFLKGYFGEFYNYIGLNLTSNLDVSTNILFYHLDIIKKILIECLKTGNNKGLEIIYRNELLNIGDDLFKSKEYDGALEIYKYCKEVLGINTTDKKLNKISFITEYENDIISINFGIKASNIQNISKTDENAKKLKNKLLECKNLFTKSEFNKLLKEIDSLIIMIEKKFIAQLDLHAKNIINDKHDFDTHSELLRFNAGLLRLISSNPQLTEKYKHICEKIISKDEENLKIALIIIRTCIKNIKDKLKSASDINAFQYIYNEYNTIRNLINSFSYEGEKILIIEIQNILKDIIIGACTKISHLKRINLQDNKDRREIKEELKLFKTYFTESILQNPYYNETSDYDSSWNFERLYFVANNKLFYNDRDKIRKLNGNGTILENIIYKTEIKTIHPLLGVHLGNISGWIEDLEKSIQDKSIIDKYNLIFIILDNFGSIYNSITLSSIENKDIIINNLEIMLKNIITKIFDILNIMLTLKDKAGIYNRNDYQIYDNTINEIIRKIVFSYGLNNIFDKKDPKSMIIMLSNDGKIYDTIYIDKIISAIKKSRKEQFSSNKIDLGIDEDTLTKNESDLMVTYLGNIKKSLHEINESIKEKIIINEYMKVWIIFNELLNTYINIKRNSDINNKDLIILNLDLLLKQTIIKILEVLSKLIINKNNIKNCSGMIHEKYENAIKIFINKMIISLDIENILTKHYWNCNSYEKVIATLTELGINGTLVNESIVNNIFNSIISRHISNVSVT